MTDFVRPADAPGHDPYIASLLDALGSRDPVQVMAETPDALRRGIAGMSEPQLSMLEAPGKWSVRRMLAHLADSELVGGFRFRMILAHRDPALPGYDQDAWAEHLHYGDAEVDTVLNTFTTLRRANLCLFQWTSPEQRHRVGLHSERGAESLGFLMNLYAGHDLVHLRQLARIRGAIGA
ncbi:MAG: DinB family protein [Gemmatimonadota bacterium]